MKLILNSSLITFCALLTACGGGGSDDDTTITSNTGGNTNPNISTNDYTIKSFTLTGSNNTSAQPAVINPSINNGGFSIQVEAENPSDTYNLKLYISSNNILGDNDILVLDQRCDFRSCPTTQVQKECTFTNSNETTCGELTADISDLLTQLPIELTAIVQTCEITGLNCGTEIATVRFE